MLINFGIFENYVNIKFNASVHYVPLYLILDNDEWAQFMNIILYMISLQFKWKWTYTHDNKKLFSGMWNNSIFAHYTKNVFIFYCAAN